MALLIWFYGGFNRIVLFSSCLRTCARKREGERELAGGTEQHLAPQDLEGSGNSTIPVVQDEDRQPVLPSGMLLEMYSSGLARGGAFV